MAVELTKSQNTTVKCRRSPIADAGIRFAPEAAPALINAVPHSWQNFAPGTLVAPQAKHSVAKGDAHC
jgi:hypothetical protein